MIPLVSRTCTICYRPDREDIDEALITGEPFRHIASRTGTSTGALQRHKADHLPATLAQARGAAELVHADNLASKAKLLWSRALNIADRAEQQHDPRTELMALAQARGVLELLAKVTPEDAPTVVQMIALPVPEESLTDKPPRPMGFLSPVAPSHST